MPTLDALLQQLIDDKAQLVKNLKIMGISEASDLMTFTELIPLILKIGNNTSEKGD